MLLQNPIADMLGAGAGTLVGYPIGKAIDFIPSYLPNSSLIRTTLSAIGSSVTLVCW